MESIKIEEEEIDINDYTILTDQDVDPFVLIPDKPTTTAPTKCLICSGESSAKIVAEKFATALCKLLQLDESDYLDQFKSASYCSTCLKYLWKIHQVLTKLEALQEQVVLMRERVQGQLLGRIYKVKREEEEVDGVGEGVNNRMDDVVDKVKRRTSTRNKLITGLGLLLDTPTPTDRVSYVSETDASVLFTTTEVPPDEGGDWDGGGDFVVEENERKRKPKGKASGSLKKHKKTPKSTSMEAEECVDEDECGNSVMDDQVNPNSNILGCNDDVQESESSKRNGERKNKDKTVGLHKKHKRTFKSKSIDAEECVKKDEGDDSVVDDHINQDILGSKSVQESKSSSKKLWVRRSTRVKPTKLEQKLVPDNADRNDDETSRQYQKKITQSRISEWREGEDMEHASSSNSDDDFLPSNEDDSDEDPNYLDQQQPTLNNPGYACEICGRKCKSEVSRLGHVKRIHEGVEMPFHCEHPGCTRSYRFPKTLAVHQLVHSVEKPFVCHHCGKCMKWKQAFEIHLQQHIDSDKKFKCNECDKEFRTAQNLRHHSYSHAKELPFKCDTCGQGYAAKYLLDKHLLVKHKAEHPFKCRYENCGKVFHSKYYLKDHYYTHTGEFPYKCDICGRGLAYPKDLERHMKIHNPERIKDIICDRCGATFTCSYGLKKHMMAHDKILNYKCDTCGKFFIDNYKLRKHSKVHTGDRQHQCSICYKCFYTPEFLKTHMDYHTEAQLQGRRTINEAKIHRRHGPGVTGARSAAKGPVKRRKRNNNAIDDDSKSNNAEDSTSIDNNFTEMNLIQQSLQSVIFGPGPTINQPIYQVSSHQFC